MKSVLTTKEPKPAGHYAQAMVHIEAIAALSVEGP